MSASINFIFETDAAAPSVDGPWGAVAGYPGSLCVTIEPARPLGGTTLKLFGTKDQLATLAQSITAFIEASEASPLASETEAA